MRRRVISWRRRAMLATKTGRSRSRFRITTPNLSSGRVTEISYVCSMGWKGETCIRFRKVPVTCRSEAALCASRTYSVRSRHGVLMTSAITLSRLVLLVLEEEERDRVESDAEVARIGQQPARAHSAASPTELARGRGRAPPGAPRRPGGDRLRGSAPAPRDARTRAGSGRGRRGARRDRTAA